MSLTAFISSKGKDRAKGSDTFPSLLPDGARAAETKHGVQVGNATRKHESIDLQSQSPSQAVIPRESAWRERGPWCLHLLGAEAPVGAAPHPLPGAPGPTYGA